MATCVEVLRVTLLTHIVTSSFDCLACMRVGTVTMFISNPLLDLLLYTSLSTSIVIDFLLFPSSASSLSLCLQTRQKENLEINIILIYCIKFIDLDLDLDLVAKQILSLRRSSHVTYIAIRSRQGCRPIALP